MYSDETVQVGDEISFTADVDEYYGLTEIKNLSNLNILSSGNALPEPYIADTWDINDESLEGVLVKVASAVCTDPDLGFGEWELNDGTGPCRVDDLGIVFTPEQGISYSVTGPLYFSYEDTTQFKLLTCALISGSTGEIKVLFNHKTDVSEALEQPAPWTAHIADTVIKFINETQQTLDITMYEQESPAIVEAINAAYDRGVQIRYVTDDMGNNPVLENLNANIPVLYGNTEAIMHDKFIIRDVNDEVNCRVMTGSLNHTVANLGWDYNNMICIQDQSLAMAYTMEFEEM